MSDSRTDLLIQYYNIAHKLRKKRILKKPNVAEASQQFQTLGISFEREDLPQYAALCYQAAAKCENSVGNILEEGLLLLKSSRQFMASYLEDLKDKCVSNPVLLNHSYVLYKECLARLKENEELSRLINDALISSIILEMAENLEVKAGFHMTGYQEYKEALKSFSQSPIENIYCLRSIVSLNIKLGDYKECLGLVNDILKDTEHLPNSGYKQNILRDLEITRILLLLILRPTSQQISLVAASALEKYAWVETSSNNDVKDLSTVLKTQDLSMLGEDLYLSLQSLVMACQYCDPESLEMLEVDLVEYLSCDQKTLLQILIKQHKTQ